MKQRILSLALALGLSVSLLTTGALAAEPGLSNFQAVNTYATGTFTDVTAVSSGTVTARKAGTATITATANSGVRGSCTVTVKQVSAGVMIVVTPA